MSSPFVSNQKCSFHRLFSDHPSSSFDVLLNLAQSQSMSSQQRVQLIQALNAAEANPSAIPPAPASTIADDYEIMGDEEIVSDPPTDGSDANNDNKGDNSDKKGADGESPQQ